LNVAIAFDISAFSLFAVILLLFINKRIAPTQTNRVFILFVLCLFFTSFFSLASLLHQIYAFISFIPFDFFRPINHALKISIPLLFSYYIFTLVASQKKISRRFIKYTLLSLLIYIGIATPATLLNINPRLSKIALSLYFIFFLLQNILFLKKNHAIFPKQKIIVLLSFVVLFTLVLNAEVYLTSFSMGNIIFALSILVLLFTTHRQEETICNISLLYNQTAFSSIYANYFEKKIPFTIVTIVLDDLFYLLKTLGIQQINAIIKETAFFLNDIAKNALIFHFNDGKFCATFNDTSEEAYLTFIEKIKERFAKAWQIDLIEIKIFPRLALIACPKDAESIEDVIEILEILQHDEKYKKEGLLYASQIDTSYRLKTAFLDHTVKNALAENRIDVYYQPIFSTEKNRIIGAEALVRMQDEKGRYISPEDFIPIAEKNGTILRIGEYVYESVCRFINETDLAFYGIEKMDVNLSVVQCMQENLSEQFLMIADLYKIPYEHLNFEITETAAIFSKKIFEQNIQRFAEAGIELSLDDYGSGYSNINYLINLPFNMIKIDKNIVWKAFLSDKSYTALSFTISMIKALGMTVLAEGVETYEQAQQLTKLGCNYLQGYYFSKPVPKELFLSLLIQNQTENEILEFIDSRNAKTQTKKILHKSIKELQSINKNIFQESVEIEDFKVLEELEEVEELEEIEEI